MFQGCFLLAVLILLILMLTFVVCCCTARRTLYSGTGKSTRFVNARRGPSIVRTNTAAGCGGGARRSLPTLASRLINAGAILSDGCDRMVIVAVVVCLLVLGVLKVWFACLISSGPPRIVRIRRRYYAHLEDG
jgi:hypothetical protein